MIKNNFELLEFFLREKEKSSSSFTMKEVELATNYKLSTIKSYFSKKLLGYLIYRKNKNVYSSIGISNLSSDEFRTHMSQSNIPRKKKDSDIFIEKLQERSVDAFTLAIENYNRPSLRNRVEAFSIFIINAWELFLKSLIVKELGYSSLFYKDSKNSLCLKDVLNKVSNEIKVFNQNCPIVKNIELLIELRDHSIHLLIPELQPELSRIFQASILNYIELYRQIFNKIPLPEIGLGLLSLVADEKSLQHPTILSNYGKETANEIEIFLKKFKTNENSLNSNQFAIPVDYKLVLTKKESEGDIKITLVKEAQEAIIINQPRNLDETHPYRQKDIVRELNKKVQLVTPLNQYSFQALVSKHKIKGDLRFHNYVKLSNTHSYSQKLIDKFVTLLNSNPQSIQEAIDFYKRKKYKN